MFLFEASNLITIGMIVLYMLSYGLKLFLIIIVSFNIQKLKQPSFWIGLVNLNPSDLDAQKQYFTTFYWLNAGNYLLYNSFLKNVTPLSNKVNQFFKIDIIGQL